MVDIKAAASCRKQHLIAFPVGSLQADVQDERSSTHFVISCRAVPSMVMLQMYLAHAMYCTLRNIICDRDMPALLEKVMSAIAGDSEEGSKESQGASQHQASTAGSSQK